MWDFLLSQINNICSSGTCNASTCTSLNQAPAPSCPQGYADCDGNPSNGCETPVNGNCPACDSKSFWFWMNWCGRSMHGAWLWGYNILCGIEWGDSPSVVIQSWSWFLLMDRRKWPAFWLPLLSSSATFQRSVTYFCPNQATSIALCAGSIFSRLEITLQQHCWSKNLRSSFICLELQKSSETRTTLPSLQWIDKAAQTQIMQGSLDFSWFLEFEISARVYSVATEDRSAWHRFA